jgi:hypothetical protein
MTSEVLSADSKPPNEFGVYDRKPAEAGFGADFNTLQRVSCPSR